MDLAIIVLALLLVVVYGGLTVEWRNGRVTPFVFAQDALRARYEECYEEEEGSLMMQSRKRYLRQLAKQLEQAESSDLRYLALGVQELLDENDDLEHILSETTELCCDLLNDVQNGQEMYKAARQGGCAEHTYIESLAA